MTITPLCLSPLLGAGFINRDDPAYITDNPLIKEFSFQTIGRIFATPQYEGDYHPLTLSAFALEYHFFHDRPAGYHAVSLLLHLIATCLAFLVFLQLTGRPLIAGIVSLLFGIHPAQIESVAWASQQKDILFALWYLGALAAYIRYVKEGNRPAFYALALVMFVFSLLSKTMAVSLAPVLLLTDYLLGRRDVRRAVLEKIPFFIIAAGFGAWSLLSREVSGSSLDVVTYGVTDRILLSGYAAFKYFAGVILPSTISTYHPYPFVPGHAPEIMILYPLSVLLLVAAVVFTHRRTRVIVFGVGFFLCNIATVMQLVPLGGAFGGNRYTYVASLGLFYVAGSLFQKLWERYARTGRAKNLFRIATGILLVTVGLLAWNRTAVWRSSVSLWTDVLNTYPDVAFLYAYRGNARRLPEEAALALADYNRAIQLKPDLAFAYFSRASLRASLGDHEAAIEDYTKAIGFSYYQPQQCYINRGSSYTSLERYGLALNDFAQAIQLAPGNTDAHYNRAGVYLRTGQYSFAISDLDIVLRSNDRDTIALYNRGIAKELIGKKSEGCSDLERAASWNFPAAVDAYKRYCR